MYDLLTDPLIGVHTPEGVQRVTLPELLAGLSAGKINGYTGLRAHQADPWHVFLVQLAASIQARHPTAALPTDPGYWRDGLLDLAEGKPSAWHLVWEEVTQPAFMQHPWTDTDKDESSTFKVTATFPDELDVVMTARGHDIKSARTHNSDIEAWLFAIVTSQTISPYGGGKGTIHGVVRMNSGIGSRCIVAWVADPHPSKRFIRETQRSIRERSKILEQGFKFRQQGVCLTWIKPWNRKENQFTIEDLEPFFIESCRFIRLVSTNGEISVRRAPTRPQVGPDSFRNGNVGDPWLPIVSETQAALNIKAPGFSPQIITDLVFFNRIEKHGFLLAEQLDDYGFLIGSVLASDGNCKTDGFYHIELPVPPKARLDLINKQSRETLGHLAQQLLADAKTVQQILGTALAALLSEGEPEKPDFERVKAWLANSRKDFSRHWEAQFFPALWRGAEEAPEAVRQGWQQYLIDGAQALLDQAIERLPLPANRTWRAITQAQGVFRAMLHKKELLRPQRNRIESLTPEEATS